MENNNELKKTITFLDKNQKDFIEGAIALLANNKGRVESAIMLKMVEERLLPTNKTAAYICKHLYAGKIDNLDAIESLSKLYFSGTSCEPKYPNGLPILEFFRKTYGNEVIDYSEETSDADKAFFEENIELLTKTAREKISKIKEEEGMEITTFNSIFEIYLNSLKKDKQIKADRFLELINNDWFILCKNKYIYGVMISMCRLIKHKEDTRDERLELIELIKKLSLTWN